MLQLFKVNVLGPKKSICYQNKGQLNANRSPPHSFARQKTGLEAKTEGAIDWKRLISSSVPSGRMWEPTRKGMRTAVLRLGRGHAGHDALDTSRVLWVKTWIFRKEERWWQQQKRKREWSNAHENRKGEEIADFLLLTENLGQPELITLLNADSLIFFVFPTNLWWSYAGTVNQLDGSGHFLSELA